MDQGYIVFIDRYSLYFRVTYIIYHIGDTKFVGSATLE